MCITSKTIWLKPYRDLQLLLVFIYQLKDFLIDFIPNLLIFSNNKSKTFYFILVIID